MAHIATGLIALGLLLAIVAFVLVLQPNRPALRKLGVVLLILLAAQALLFARRMLGL